MSNVVFNSISKIYNKDIKAVDNIALNIESGELLVLCGPSGCGKSTLLRMLAGLEEISSGEILINDKVVNHIPPKDRDVAMVFQNYALYPHMSVFDNIAFSLKLRRTPKNEIRKRVEKTANTLGLSDLLKRKPKTLSGGQRQRIAMGRAIVRNPSIFLFDEPLSNLDAKMRTELRKEILNIHQSVDSTMIYVTHDQIEALTLGDRICVMNQGKIEQVGTPNEVFNTPSTLFVAQFIGTPPMNIIEGVLFIDAGKLFFKSDLFTCVLTTDQIPNFESLENKKVYCGIRPKDFVIEDQKSSSNIEGVMEVSEMLGEETLIHIKSNSYTVIAKIMNENKKYDINEIIRLSPKPEKIQIFDKESEKNITNLIKQSS